MPIKRQRGLLVFQKRCCCLPPEVEMTLWEDCPLAMGCVCWPLSPFLGLGLAQCPSPQKVNLDGRRCTPGSTTWICMAPTPTLKGWLCLHCEEICQSWSWRIKEGQHKLLFVCRLCQPQQVVEPSPTTRACWITNLSEKRKSRWSAFGQGLRAAVSNKRAARGTTSE